MKGNNILNYVLGLLTAALLSVALVFAFAIVLANVGVSPNFIRPVNQAIKAAAVATGGIIALKGDKGAVKGLIFGAIYAVAVDLLFALIAGGVSFDLFFLLDIVVCSMVCAIVGIVKVNAAGR